MKPSLLLSLALLPLLGCDGTSAPKRRAEVPQEPDPKPWTPPKTKLPAAVVEETSFLLAHGMADPRGGEYRTAKAYVGSLWGQEEKPALVHGWVLPGSKRIVAPNGLAYDAVEIGGKADLEGDIKAEIDRWRAVKAPKMRFPGPRNPAWGPLGIRLLLVAGRVDLAERLAEVMPGDPNRYGGAVLEEFLSTAFDQALTAHMRGDDATALRVARTLDRVRPDFEKRLLATVDPRTHAAPGGRIIGGAAFPFLDPVPQLIADAERRLASPHKGLFDPKTASVAELIDHLDEVKARQWGQPGEIDWSQDPIIQALAAKGAEAAEPLFDAMERDTRLTRSVSFGRDFFPGRNLMPVRFAALMAFQAFAQTDNFPAGAGIQLDVPKLRAYWAANKGKSGSERWFDTLADDQAGWRRWEEAARRLFDPQGTVRMGYSSTFDPRRPPNAEALRGRANPSLSDLIERRAREVMADPSEGAPGPSRLPIALQFGLFLNRWDPPRSVATLRDASHRAIDALGERAMMNDYAGTFVVPALEARADAGDATAWDDYKTLLSKIGEFPSFDSKLLRPMAEHPEVPAVREATKLLATAGSPFDAVGRLRKEPGFAGFDPIVVSPLLKLSVLFDAVLKGLADRSVIGTSHIDDRGNGWFEANGKPFPAQGVRPEPGDPKPKAGRKVPLRMADVVAHDLARLKGAPKFQPFWPVAQKDAAIGKMRAFLLENRDRIVETIPPPNDWKSGYDARRGW